MMKSPTSLIRFRNAVGVVLALSAIFAVVISTISLTSDDASAQVADENAEAITARATAWWNTLNNVEMVNVLRGNDADDDAETAGRQLGDPTRTNIDPNVMDAEGNEGVPHSLVEQAQRMFADLETADKEAVEALVDGNSDPSDIYAVGDHIATDVQALRGFQSVEMWWNYIDCTEARTAVGEDNGALTLTGFNDPFTTETEDIPEPSNVCEIVDDPAIPDTNIARAKAYSDVKAIADKVGQPLLGLAANNAPVSGDHTRSMYWWATLNNCQMINALWGDGLGDCTPGTPSAVEDPPTLANKAERPYNTMGEMTGLDAATKALVNDRWQWIYNNAGRDTPNTMGTDEVIHWWNTIDCASMRVAVGVDNQGVDPLPDADAYCAMWDGLNDATSPTDPGQVRQARVLEVGRAILGIKPLSLPAVAAWWDTLSKDQMVYVVYGNPPMRSTYQEAGDPMADTTDVTDADKAVFQKMYGDLAGGIDVATANTALSTHLPERITTMLGRNDFDVTAPTAGPDGDDAGTDPDSYFYSAKGIVHALANEIFDPPTGQMVTSDAAVTVVDDNDFDWPYKADNGPATVADWWETTDCRVMRIAVGEDNDYLDPAVAAVEAVAAIPAETSDFCGHFPGSDMIPMDGMPISPMAQTRIETVGRALLGLGNDPGRPSFNEPPDPNKVPTISGTAQVGSLLTADPGPIDDEDGEGTFKYQWLRDGADIKGATSKTYVVQPEDVNAAISVRVKYVDGENFYEMITSNATSTIAGSPGQISRIEPGIRGITVSGGDTVTLSVDIYGLQDAKDNGIGGNFTWDENGDEIDDETGRELSYTASSSPGTYTVTASLTGADCQPEVEADRATACSAEFDVTVRRPSADGPEQDDPVNPPGPIPGILADSDGNQYEVFTPVEGGTFTGEGYSLNVAPGAVPNGEFLGIRMSDEGAASNLGMTHQRYTLGGNMYAISAVDSSQAAISSYVLDDPALACVPLPDELRSNISDLALVAINGDGSLTILAAQVRISSAGNMVCGALSNLPASVAVGSSGAPAAIPTPTPEPTAVPPPTGGTAPASSMVVLWSMLLGIAVFALGSVLVIARRREGARTR